MKATTFVAAAVAATMGFSSLSFAQDRRGDREERRAERRAERIENRQDRRLDRIENRQERRLQRIDNRHDRREARSDWRRDHRQYVRPAPPVYHQPSYQWRTARHYAPRVRYINTAPQYYYRGDVLPYHYRQNMVVVNDWSHHGLYAPPYGHQWVRSDTGEILLIALATGLIANMLMR